MWISYPIRAASLLLCRSADVFVRCLRNRSGKEFPTADPIWRGTSHLVWNWNSSWPSQRHLKQSISVICNVSNSWCGICVVCGQRVIPIPRSTTTSRAPGGWHLFVFQHLHDGWYSATTHTRPPTYLVKKQQSRVVPNLWIDMSSDLVVLDYTL